MSTMAADEWRKPRNRSARRHSAKLPVPVTRSCRPLDSASIDPHLRHHGGFSVDGLNRLHWPLAHATTTWDDERLPQKKLAGAVRTRTWAKRQRSGSSSVHIRHAVPGQSAPCPRPYRFIASLGGAAAVVCSRTRAAALPTDRPICNARAPNNRAILRLARSRRSRSPRRPAY